MATTCRTAPGWTGPGDADDGAVLLGDGDRHGGCVEGEAPTRHGRLAPASRAAASLAGSVIGREPTVPRPRQADAWRSEERRGGRVWVSMSRARCLPNTYKKKDQKS